MYRPQWLSNNEFFCGVYSFSSCNLVCRQGLIKAHCFVLQSVTAMAMLRNADLIQLHLLILILLVVVSVSTVCITLLVVNVRSVSLCIFRIHPKTLEIQLLVFVSPVQVF